MAWTIKFAEIAAKQMQKLYKTKSKLILNYLNLHIASSENLRNSGKALGNDKKGLWRYRVENYRVICEIKDSELIVLVLRVAHRKEVYK